MSNGRLNVQVLDLTLGLHLIHMAFMNFDELEYFLWSDLKRLLRTLFIETDTLNDDEHLWIGTIHRYCPV